MKIFFTSIPIPSSVKADTRMTSCNTNIRISFFLFLFFTIGTFYMFFFVNLNDEIDGANTVQRKSFALRAD